MLESLLVAGIVSREGLDAKRPSGGLRLEDQAVPDRDSRNEMRQTERPQGAGSNAYVVHGDRENVFAGLQRAGEREAVKVTSTAWAPLS